MTKILVSTKQTQGQRKNDFSHATEGEIVTFASECDGEAVDGKCGCKRAMSGVESRKATTTMMVVERDLTVESLTDILHKSLVGGGWVKAVGTVEEQREGRAWAAEDARELLRLAATMPLGAIVEKRGNKFALRRTDEERAARSNAKAALDTVEDFLASPLFGEKLLRDACRTKTIYRVKGLQGLRQTKEPYSPALAARLREQHGAALLFIVNEHPSMSAVTAAASKMAGVRKGVWVEWSNTKGDKVVGLVTRMNTKTVSLKTEAGQEFRVGIGGTFKVVEAPSRRAPVAAALVTPGAPDLDARLRDAGWLHDGQVLGVPADATIQRLAFKHEDTAEDAAIGPVFAVTPAGQYFPLVKAAKGHTEWFLLSEAKKVARCVGVSLREE